MRTRRLAWRRAFAAGLATAAVVPVLSAAGAGAATTRAQGGSSLSATCAGAPLGIGSLTKPQAKDFGANINAYVAAMNKYNDYTTAMARDTAAYTKIGADGYYKAKVFGQGVDVALIDSGVDSALPGLDQGNVVDGPDLSFDSQAGYGSKANKAIVHNDLFGHGTHLASIIAGRDSKVTDPNAFDPAAGGFMGVAPLARVVNVKVANGRGATDVTQVISAVDWVVRHAHDQGLNIRVINLSYGLDASDNRNVDALSFAVEQAWNAGIVVVAAAGNSGKSTSRDDPGLTSPAYNRDIIAVGAIDGSGSAADYSSGASGVNPRDPDVAAPGSLLGLHVPGSDADAEIIDACTGKGLPSPVLGPNIDGEGRFLRGSGTSQASALVSGAVALMLSRNPELTPDQVKVVLRVGAAPSGSQRVVGQGVINLAASYKRIAAGQLGGAQNGNAVAGGGSLDDARGTVRLADGTRVPNFLVGPTGVALRGDIDWLGRRANTNPRSGQTIEQSERVDPRHSPYCLPQSDWVAQTGYTNGTCTSPATRDMPTIWHTALRLVGTKLQIGEGWNNSFLLLTGPTALSGGVEPAQWGIGGDTWMGPDPQNVDWAKHAWTGHSWKWTGWSVSSFLSADAFLKMAWKGDSLSKMAWKAGSWS